MSYTNGTTHYNLPLTTGADKRDWSDTNQAFSDVDAALYGAVQDTAQAELDIDALETRMDTAEQNISTNTGNIAGLDTRVTTVEGAITSLSGQVTDTRQDLEDMICAFNEASATSTHAYAIGDYFIYNDVLYKATQVIAIGDTIVPDTNCATTNVTTEMLATEDLSDVVSQLQTDVEQLESDVNALNDATNTTTLWTGNAGGYQGSDNVILSESYQHFKFLRIYANTDGDATSQANYRDVWRLHVNIISSEQLNSIRNASVNAAVEIHEGFGSNSDYISFLNTSTDTQLSFNFNKSNMYKIEGVEKIS